MKVIIHSTLHIFYVALCFATSIHPLEPPTLPPPILDTINTPPHFMPKFLFKTLLIFIATLSPIDMHMDINHQ